MSSIVGALGDAWSELRHHRLRVLLSLIGIAVSVGAITAVIALGEYQRQQMAEQSDRFGGRQATISVTAFAADGSPMDPAAFDERVDRVSERFGFSHRTRVVIGSSVEVQTPDQVRTVGLRLVDPAYSVIHRAPLLEGRWFRAGDEQLLAPPVVVTESLWDAFGRPALGTFALHLQGEVDGSYSVIGVTPRQYPGDEEKLLTALFDGYASRVDTLPVATQMTWEMWVTSDQVAEIGPALATDLRAGLDDSIEVSVTRSDWGSRPEMAAQMAMFELITGGIAGLVLLLGGLGLVNIQLVAMRQRIREIGVRRSFGATGSRVFFSVLLESVVATAVAGVVGIALAIAIMKAPFVEQLFQGLQDVPPFPLRAAVIGLVAAVAIGALAGFIPAIVAVRARVIDALRF
ncbi:ABC transporter permease [Microbacterium sp. BWT-B31]|uniref:ABC transporter permease n=1 Tax=Microbacterium sp. BWT-B31 TaxID=3232072 RepID=UPI003528CA47